LSASEPRDSGGIYAECHGDIGCGLPRGGFPASHHLWVGMPGMHGTYTANMAFTECDLVIAIGTRFDDRVTGDLGKFSPKAKIVQIDIDPASIRQNVKTDVPIL